MATQWIFFGGFMVFILFMLALDLGVFHKKDHEIKTREALTWTLVWISLAMLFGVLLLTCGDWMLGHTAADAAAAKAFRREIFTQYLAGYFLEESLSIDNIFVMIMLFASFGVEKQYYHRVLFWGILGAIVLRFVFIFALGELVTKFSWVLAVFGVILIYSGVKMFADKGDKSVDTANHPVVKFAAKHFRVTREFHGHDFFTHVDGKRFITPLFVVLLVVEFSDIIFAVDSIPAVFSVTKDPFIVYFSNIFAIMGLRSLFFLLSGITDKFWMLHYGLGVLLSFIGIKMIVSELWHIEISTVASLLVILGILAGSIALSLAIPQPQKRKQ
ncbi:MAG: TerC family protein [Bacteroidales bacterium]|nr:TerC family protein [Bacteroidales bacterium]